MGRSKPRTNKRPPPKRPLPPISQLPPVTQPHPSLDPTNPAFDLSAYVSPPPPPTSDPNDPSYATALHEWSTSALGQMANLTQSQLSALAGAATSVGGPLMGNGRNGGYGIVSAAVFDAMRKGLPPGATPVAGFQVTTDSKGNIIQPAGGGNANGNGNGNGNGNPNLPIDLPASLAALFEAKLTLDREKAKLMRMQKELKGYREGVAAVQGQEGGQITGNGKGKEVMVEDDLGECTCGRNGHSHHYPASAHSGDNSEDYYYYSSDGEGCDCSCSHDHSIECEHGEGCDCEHDQSYEDDEEGGGSHNHHHHHHHHHDDNHHHHHHHHHHDHEHDHDHDHQDGYDHQEEDHYPDERAESDRNLDQVQNILTNINNNLNRSAPPNIPLPLAPHLQPIPYPTEAEHPHPQGYGNSDPSLNMTYAEAFEAYQDTRDQAAKGLDDIGGMFKAAGWEGYAPNGEVVGIDNRPRKRLADDPERLDEAVRELFNWIKAVVWTIEQAAIVAGRRGWAQETTR